MTDIYTCDSESCVGIALRFDDLVDGRYCEPCWERATASHREIERLRAERDELVEALRVIDRHPACDYNYHTTSTSDCDRQYKIGLTDAHRLAANIARATLKKVTK